MPDIAASSIKPALAQKKQRMKRALLAGVVATFAMAAPSQSAEPSVYEACATDHALLCPQRSVASEGALQCLRAHADEVGPSCRRALAARREALLQRVRGACADEIGSYCATGEKALHVIRCLRRVKAELSAVCRAALPRSIS